MSGPPPPSSSTPSSPPPPPPPPPARSPPPNNLDEHTTTTITEQQQQQQQQQHDFANPTLNIISSGSGSGGSRPLSRKTSISSALSTNTTIFSRRGEEEEEEETTPPPPLPPRPPPPRLVVESRPPTSYSTNTNAAAAVARPSLVAKATTQLSYANFNGGSDGDDSASLRSFALTLDPTDAESMIGDVLVDAPLRRTFADNESASLFEPEPELEKAFAREFEEVDELGSDGVDDEEVMKQWRGKLKHFLILSSAGKPIYSRHGSDQLITNYIGVIQTLISFYQSTSDTLRGFTAGSARFVVATKGPLYLVAITRLPESDAQLRAQLDALYMQILSTLTLPSMQRMFAARANYDLRRPLQGTETLLSALADGFTRGSPSTLLSALECLRLRKSHRATINNTLLRARTQNLLYGLLVASGKLVSVVRPKKHSLHPGDLQLIFNMLFEARGVKAAGAEENWIPLCLPGFNNTGYLYMHVSFLKLDKREGEGAEEGEEGQSGEDGGDDDEVAVLLISAKKEAFFEMRGMRDELVEQLEQNGSIDVIRTALHRGRPSCTDVVPGMVLRHFLYKSRGNVQFVMPRFEPAFVGAWERRRLLTLYATLQSTLHAKPTSLKIVHQSSATYVALAWQTPLFELYAVAPASASRKALAAAAMSVVAWVKREEEAAFIIGGAVF
ncbi:DUF254-domain-containing protein [Periconia macrospinosa]|uniref:Vacuolar fusion protein MON1 n=1 Tax=Periconia macrospinosa TaxID=97972 RepID=A0A2V1DFJ9_9PLEO|nr:DUF254-domain-containing protein [Periconia macrospinosa]